MARIYVHRAYHYFLDASFNDLICARTCVANGGTGFQGNIKRRLFWHWATEIAQAIDLGVFTACFAVMSFCDDPILHNQNGSYRWIGTRSSGRLAGFL